MDTIHALLAKGMVGSAMLERVAVMSHSSLRLTARDFDAYTSDKATSKAYSRPRLEVKQSALAWARPVATRLANLDISVEIDSSDEHPSIRNKHCADRQWIFFWRDHTARDELDRLLEQGRSMSDVIGDPSPHTRHAVLALHITASEVEAGFFVHPDASVDIDNLRALIETDTTFGPRFIQALHALPEQFVLAAGPARIMCGTATSEATFDLIHHVTEGQTPLWIGWSLPRETAIEHADILGEQLEDAIVSLAPVYRMIAWSRDNDHIALDRKLEGFEQERARTHAEREAETERWKAEQAAARERSMEQARARSEVRAGDALPPRRVTLATLFNPPSTGRHHAPRTEDAVRTGQGQRIHSHETVLSPERHLSSPLLPIERGTMDVGCQVRVLRGPFGGKIGTVSELDGRGGARVLLGLLSTRLELDDIELVVETPERPALASSHRKPMTSAHRKVR